MRALLTILAAICLYPLIAQNKKVMDHGIYAIWRKIENPIISNDGKWVAYRAVCNAECDATLYLWNATTGQTTPFDRGYDAQFTFDNTYFIFKVKQPLDTLKAKRRKKVKEEDLPKDDLTILNLSDYSTQVVKNVNSFAVPQKWSGYMAYQMEIEKPEMPKRDTPQDSTDAKKLKTKPKAESKENGTKVILYNFISQKKDTFPFAVDYLFAKKGKQFLVADTGIDSINVSGVHIFDCDKGFKKTILKRKGKYKQLALDEAGMQAAFIADLDTTKERVRPFEMYYWRNTADSAKLIAQSNRDYGMLKSFLISENAKPVFSEDGTKLYFGVAPQPILNDTTLLPEEIVNVEVWSHNDSRLHTQQKVQLERDRKKSYDVVYYPLTNQVTPIATPELPDAVFQDRRNIDIALTSTDEPYLKAATWEGSPAKDVYLTDLKTGSKTLIIKKLRGNAAISPAGKYVFWYNELDSAWFAYSVLNKTTKRITNIPDVKFYDEENDMPDYPNPYGYAAWTRDDRHILIYDRYDIWQIDPLSLEKPLLLTNGRKAQTQYRYVKLDPEERFLEPNAELFLTSVNDNTKAEGYHVFKLNDKTMTPLIAENAMLSRPIKAKNAKQYLFTKQNYQVFPDLLYSNDFKNIQKVSDVNPQQNEYNWGSIELIEWTALDGQKLRGMLVKPDGFDPKQKYPMIVNFYEKSTDQLHAHRAPEPLRSQINYTFYANRGYVVFNPDIPYRVGYPGESCLNAVISGVTHLINQGFIDEKRIAVQGHSWGGYQAAYLITKTNIFRCAEAGAPVVNMVSAYSGIRWESGLMRQFQYEHSQSRIGGSLWEYPLRFLENSPVFTADKINTPVLILHNDKDGAVPWYQGIEFYGALRRLGKPAWLLNYNDEPHWPVKLQNRIDFQIRMQQFFDYYLKDAPMPLWMKRGVPAIEKGIRQGYDLIEKK